MNKIKCIYAIKDKRNDKVIYIGQTVDFNQRKSTHFNTVQRPIQKYMYEQGRDNFEMFIIQELNEDVSKEEMNDREQYYIEKYDTIIVGLNKRKSGNFTKQQQSADWYNRNKENVKKYIEDNKEHIKERRHVWYLKNRERILLKQNNKYQLVKDTIDFKEKEKNRHKKWYQKKKLESQDK